jgi:phosphate butyryltransferase
VSLREKGIHSVIDGQADALIFPDIVAGNVFYKTITLFGYAKTAGVLQGTQCCCVLPSRADSPDSKYYSLALAAI